MRTAHEPRDSRPWRPPTPLRPRPRPLRPRRPGRVPGVPAAKGTARSPPRNRGRRGPLSAGTGRGSGVARRSGWALPREGRRRLSPSDPAAEEGRAPAGCGDGPGGGEGRGEGGEMGEGVGATRAGAWGREGGRCAEPGART